MQFSFAFRFIGQVLFYNQDRNKREDKTMLEQIRYFILMHKLRGEIAAFVRKPDDVPAHKGVSLQTGVKSTCKACGSIV